MAANADQDTHDPRDSLVAGAGAGVLAYILGYVLTFALASGEARRLFGDDVPAWKPVAWFYYNAHFVDLLSSGSADPFAGTEAVSLIAESGTAGTTVLYAVPPLVLLGAGLAAAHHIDATAPAAAVRSGAAAVPGYGGPAFLMALAATHTVSGTVFGVEVSQSIRVAPLTALVLAGVVYPAVFGVAGAVLRTQLD